MLLISSPGSWASPGRSLGQRQRDLLRKPVWESTPWAEGAATAPSGPTSEGHARVPFADTYNEASAAGSRSDASHSWGAGAEAASKWNSSWPTPQHCRPADRWSRPRDDGDRDERGDADYD